MVRGRMRFPLEISFCEDCSSRDSEEPLYPSSFALCREPAGSERLEVSGTGHGGSDFLLPVVGIRDALFSENTAALLIGLPGKPDQSASVALGRQTTTP